MQQTRVRRAALGALATLVVVPLAACGNGSSSADSPDSPAPSGSAAGAGGTRKGAVAREFKGLEKKYDARLGVYAVDTGSGREVAYRDGERFPYASTFKALAAGAVLKKHSLGGMDKKVAITKDDMVDPSPVVEKHIGGEMSLSQLCDAALRYSDNTAGNLLLKELGGPKKLDAVLEQAGDDVTHMVRGEPQLNRWAPGEKRDTSTPRAFAKDLRAFVLGDVLNKRERAQLTTWLRTNTTGDDVIRAGMPQGWKVGDKTGTGSGYGARNDIAVVWPPDSAPLVLAILSHRDEKDADHDDKLIADAASVVARRLS